MICALFFLTRFLTFGFGLILNETAEIPPRTELYKHKTAQFGVQTSDSTYERSGHLVAISPPNGCRNIENWKDLWGAIVLVKRSSCEFIQQALNVQKFGGLGMVVGNIDDTLISMTGEPLSYDLNIPCVSVTNSTYNDAFSKVNKETEGSVIATISKVGDVPLLSQKQIVLALLYVLVFIFWFLVIWWFCWEQWENCHKQGGRLIRDIPEVLLTKNFMDSNFNSQVSIPKHKIRLKNDCCPICQECFELHTKIKLISCHHGFHSECIRPWIEKNSTCPICRQTIKIMAEKSKRRSWRACYCQCLLRRVSSEEVLDQPLLLSDAEEEKLPWRVSAVENQCLEESSIQEDVENAYKQNFTKLRTAKPVPTNYAGVKIKESKYDEVASHLSI